MNSHDDERSPNSPTTTLQSKQIQVQSIKKRSGHWSQKECRKHFLFVYHHLEKFKSKSLRKSLSIFRLMAQFIKTRNPSQCRTHHQKLVLSNQSLQSCLKSYIDEHQDFYDNYQKVKKTLALFQDYDFCLNAVPLEIDEDKIIEGKSRIEKDPLLVNNPTQHCSLSTEIIKEKTYDQQLHECHEKFLRWYNKLQTLLIAEQRLSQKSNSNQV